MNPYTSYYSKQAESGVGTNYYHHQTGHGIGNFLGNIFSKIFPLLKSGFSAVKDELLTGGVGLLSDTLHQVPIKESLTNRIRKMGSNLTDRAVNKVSTMTGSGAYKRRRSASSKRQSTVRAKRRKSKKRTVKRGRVSKPKQKKKKKVGRKQNKRKRCTKKKKQSFDIFG